MTTKEFAQPFFKPLNYLLWYQFLGALLIALVVWLSLARIDSAPDFQSSDKIGHVLAYLMLTSWFAQIVRKGLPLVVVCGLLLALGVFLEWAQGMTDYRQTEAADVLANAIGIIAGGTLGATRLGGLLAGFERAKTLSP